MDSLEAEAAKGSATTAARPVEQERSTIASSKGLAIDEVFCPIDVDDPFDTVQWDLRTAAIKGESGDVLFEQKECEIPADWTQLATNVVVSKYFYGELGTSERETSVRQLIHRVCRTIADWGAEDGYFADAQDGQRFYRELTWLCLHQHASFNSPRGPLVLIRWTVTPALLSSSGPWPAASVAT